MVREFEIVSDLFMGLYAIGPDGSTVPGLAQEVTVSDDGLTWTFTLREAYWSDGAPITADDAVLGVRRFLDPSTLNQRAINLFMIENAEDANAGSASLESIGAVALDQRRLRLDLVHPAHYLPDILTQSGVPVPSHAIEAHGESWAQPGLMVSSGPYTLSQWRSNAYVRLDRNDAFFDAGNVCFESVFYYPSSDRQAAERRVRAGEIDLNVEISTGSLQFLEANHPDMLHRSPGFRANDLIFNTKQPPFDDLRVRRALSMAIDRRFLANEVTRGVKQPNWRLMSPDLPGDGDHVRVEFHADEMQTRRAEARALLIAAGYGPENPLRVTLRIHPGFPLGGPVIQQDWAAVAPWVSAELLQNDIQLHYASMRAGDFDVGYAGWTPDYADPYAVLHLWEAGAGDLNFAGWTDEAFDALLEAARHESDPETRLALMSDAERLVLASHAHAPLTVDVNFDLVRPDITGWIANPIGRNPSRWLCREGLEPIQ
ncbi:MAG: peptide ABC transporter substrate-binding protein [Oceanicaulis sp.]